MTESAAIDLGIEGIGPATPLASGGFAQVYTAEQTSFRRTVAVKVLFASETNSDAFSRFERECHALGAVSDHPNIVVVHDRGSTKSGFPYIIMEYRKGGSLSERLKAEGSMTSHEVIGLGVKIGRALRVAHGEKVLHRDVKPANILLSSYGEPALADFGIARIEGGNKTTSGKFTASIAHAPPEVLRGDEPTESSDVYSLASTMFELFVGHPPYTNENSASVWAMMNRIMTEPAPDPRSFGMPEAMAAVIQRGLSEPDAGRFESAADFVTALESLELERRPVATASYLSNKAPSAEPLSAAKQPDEKPLGIVGVGGSESASPEIDPTTPTTVAEPAALAGSGPSDGKNRRPRGLFVGALVVFAGLCVAALAVLPTDLLNATSVLSLESSQSGPLEAGSQYKLNLTSANRDNVHQLIVDGQPFGRADKQLPFYRAEPGRHSIQIEIDGDSDERTNAVEVYVTPEFDEGSYRANLASVSQTDDNWPAAIAEFDQLLAEGHSEVKLAASDDGNWWFFFVDGFAERDDAQEYCDGKDLESTDCFVRARN